MGISAYIYKKVTIKSMRKCLNYRLGRRFGDIIKTINKKKIDNSTCFYKQLRIYKEKSNTGLANAKIVWSICELDSVVDNGNFLYYLSKRLFGRNLTHFIMSNTMGKQFTAGHDTQDLRKTVLNLNSIGFGAMIDYLAEMKEGIEVTEDKFDMNCNKIVLAIRETHINDNNSFALKFSALCNTKTLKKASKTQNLIDRLFNQDLNNQSNLIKLEDLKNNLKNSQIEFSDEDFTNFIELIKIPELDATVRNGP